MKIAFIKQKYIPFGGGEGYLFGLMSLCAQQGHEVHLIATHWDSGEKDHPFHFHQVDINKLTRSTRVHSFANAVQRCVQDHNFDCVFSSERTVSQDVWRGGDGLYPVWLKQRAIFEPWYKTLFNKYSAGQRAVVQMEERCVHSTPYLIANSEMIKDHLLATYSGLAAEITVIHNGIDLQRFTISNREENRLRFRQQYNVSIDTPLIGFVGSGFERKGLRELMLAIAQLPEVILFVAGRDNPHYWQKLANSIEVSNRVRFIGGVKDVTALYHAVDVTVLPSWFDSFGFVGLESIACGTPYVVTRQAGSHETIQEGVNGYTVSRADAIDEMSEAIQKALTLKNSDTISATISDWTAATNMKKTLQVLTKAAGAR